MDADDDFGFNQGNHKMIEGCSGLKVYRTTINENSEWKKFGENANNHSCTFAEKTGSR